MMERVIMINSTFLDEPVLLFGNGGRHIDPKAGLSLFGPSGHPDGYQVPNSITAGIVSPDEVYEKTKSFIEALNKSYTPDKENLRFHPPFPGMPIAFRCVLRVPDHLVYRIPQKALDLAISQPSHKRRITDVSLLFQNGLKTLSEKMGRPNIVFCPWSKEIQEKCSGPDQNKTLPYDLRNFRNELLKQEESGQTRLFPLDQETITLMNTGKSSSNLHSQLKLDAFTIKSPIQVLMPRTITGESQKSDPNTLWNLATAIYYKCGGIPWRPAITDSSVCYIGVSFYKDKTSSHEELRTCMAQVFSDSGQSLVLRGGKVPAPSIGHKSPQMTQEAAEGLFRGSLELFKDHNGHYPQRVVVHKSSHFSKIEKKAAQDCFEGVVNNIDLITILKEHEIQFVRRGIKAILRGTYIDLGNKESLLYTGGYIPYLGMYPGPRVPLPLHIFHEYGRMDDLGLAKEIMKLSKLNWNNCHYSDVMPCTLSYTSLVKEVLSCAVEEQDVSEDYSHYM